MTLSVTIVSSFCTSLIFGSFSLISTGNFSSSVHRIFLSPLTFSLSVTFLSASDLSSSSGVFSFSSSLATSSVLDLLIDAFFSGVMSNLTVHFFTSGAFLRILPIFAWNALPRRAVCLPLFIGSSCFFSSSFLSSFLSLSSVSSISITGSVDKGPVFLVLLHTIMAALPCPRPRLPFFEAPEPRAVTAFCTAGSLIPLQRQKSKRIFKNTFKM